MSLGLSLLTFTTFMSARIIFCRCCGVGGAHRYGKDRQRRQRYKCPDCGAIFTQRTRTMKSGSRLTDRQWSDAARIFSTRGGMCAEDLADVLSINRKTAQRINRSFRVLAGGLKPKIIAGSTEWDESMFSGQWVLGGVSREQKQCLLQPIPARTERILVPLVEKHSHPESLIFTDEWGGYIGLMNHWTVCHAREFVNTQARFVHTNTQEGIWGHAKTLSWHVYRGIPVANLENYLSEIMFRYNFPAYQTRLSLLLALLNRKTNSLLV